MTSIMAQTVRRHRYYHHPGHLINEQTFLPLDASEEQVTAPIENRRKPKQARIKEV
jgi:hypothetical protein